MKKFLALVLALVMTMSLVTISAGAEDFTDADKVTYTEAVDVMTALEVVGGYADGSFNPTAGLTRGAAAKIICNMILGPTTAEALSANDAPFSDVAADNVFAGYIAYCVNEGIISGYADGTFKPAAPLTGYAFMKMLLGALGYDAAIEGYVGTNWSIAVAKRALNIGLDAGLEGDFTGAKALTREEAALYAFNTLKANVVDYDNNSSITVGDIVITNSSKAEPVVNSKSDYRGAAYFGDGKENILQFCEQYFAKLALADTVDKYASSANKWTYKGKTVGSYNGDATLVYTEALKAADIEADLEDYNNYNDASAKADLWENGKQAADMTVTAAAVAALTGNGTVVEVYVTDNVVTKVVVIETVVAEVTAISDKNETITLAVKPSATTFGDASSVTLTTDVGYGDFAKKDLVLVTAYNTSSNDVSGATVTAVEALETVEGLATKKNAAKDTITIDGTVYEAAEGIVVAKNVDAFGVSSKYAATLYLDSYGYIVYAKAGAASTDDTAVAVLKKYQSLNEDGELVWMIKGINSAGEEIAWETEAEALDTDVNKVRLYADSDNDDQYTLAEPSAVVAKTAGVVNDGQTVYTSDTDIAKGAKTLTVGGEKMYFADGVKFIYFSAGKYSVKEGVQELSNAPTYAVVDVVDDVPYITTLFVRGVAGNTTTDMNDIVLVIGGTTGNYDLTDKDGKTQTFKTYDAYVAGELVENFYSDDTVASTGFYEIEVDNDNGDYVLTGNEYGTGDKDELSVTADAAYVSLVGNILTVDSADFDISAATFVDTTDSEYTSFAEVKADVADSTNTGVYGANCVVVYDFDTKVASYVYLTAIDTTP